jgi:hypothetical protein
MDWHQPTKSQKKKLKAIIEKGFKKEHIHALKQAKAIIEQWDKGIISGEDAWTKLYDCVTGTDGAIEKRYDMRGSQYNRVVLSLLLDKIIDEDDLADLDPELKNHILEAKKAFQKTP